MPNFTYEDDMLDVETPVFEPEPMVDQPTPQATSEHARLELAVNVLKQMHDSLSHVISLLQGADATDGARRMAELVTARRDISRVMEEGSGMRILEGVFDGVSMIGSDGKSYSIPPNYASKSRLVEGDVLKLTIRPDGSFLFKQIGPIERRRVVGCVGFDTSTGTHVVICGEMTYKVLPASMSFFKADAGDEAIILLPKSRESVWAAVENVVRK